MTTARQMTQFGRGPWLTRDAVLTAVILYGPRYLLFPDYMIPRFG
ncbi:hypothetical protein [Methanolobus psychrotolerans]|nr:hypothetical protein [Methanolobus psychrotolerans]